MKKVKPKKSPFQVYLYPDEREALGELADKKDESVNGYLRKLIKRHLANAK